ncbi:MAG: hypothetical protein FWC55_10285, partial [Firmicutes bacterium]|nr:hypothetical protein [Bacillota bacterium]
MKLKKFTAGTERAAIEAVRDELGPEALVLSIKRIRQNGFLSFFGRQSVEITAAYEDADASVPAAPAERRATGAPPSGRRTAGAQSASGETAGPLSVGRAGGAPYKTTGETSANGAPAGWLDTFYAALRGAKRAGGAPPGTAGNDPVTRGTANDDPAPERWPDTLYTALRGAKRPGGVPPETVGNNLATRGTANDDPAPERWPDTLYTALRGAKHADGAPPEMLSGSAASGSQPTDVSSKTTGETSAGGAPARWPDTLYTALRGAKHAGGAPPGMLSGSAVSGSQPTDVSSKTTDETSAGGAPARWPDTLYTALRGAKHAGGAPPGTAGNDPATHRTTYNDPAPERWPDTLYTALRGA